MKVLKTGSDQQEIKIIPREYVSSITLTLRDDQLNTSVDYELTGKEWEWEDAVWNLADYNWESDDTGFVIDNDYMIIKNQYNLIEGHFYDLTIKNSSDEVIYKDRIFCTDQTISEATNQYYTVNKDQYTVDTSYDNEYVIL